MALFRRGKSERPADEAAVPETTTPGPTTGPFDKADVEGMGDRFDLGALWLPGIDRMQLQLEVDQNAGTVNGVTAALGDSALQLQAFAAPRTLGIWDDIRDEIAESIRTSGGQAQVVDGRFGTELEATLPQQGPGGQPVQVPVRFLGVDGPRWFLRGFVSGPAAADEAAAAPLLDLFADVVVIRGDQAMAPRELLPLKMPEQAEPHEPVDAPDSPERFNDLSPFERGPEITEVG